MATTNIYLNFNGNCEAAFNFYKTVFGEDFRFLGRFGEMAANSDFQFPEQDKDRIMHVSLPIGSSILMGSDCSSEGGPEFKMGNNFSVSITADSKEEADRLYTALSKNGKGLMPMADAFWGDYFGTLEDQFGINWMISYNEAYQMNNG